MLYYGLTLRLSKVLIFLTIGIRANSDIWHSGVAQAHTKVLEVHTKRCNVRSMDKRPWSGGQKVHDMSLTIAPGVGTKVYAMSMKEGPGEGAKKFMTQVQQESME